MSIPVPRNGIASQRIADNLRDAILRGEYSPGTRLRQEDIAEQFGASRLPVREALRILEADGLVTLVANTGAWISRLSLAECEEMYQIRERIEPLLLRYSMPQLTEDTIGRLHELRREMQAATDVEDFMRLDREFHLLSYTGATTALLGDSVLRLWNTTQHYRRAYTRLFRSEGDVAVHLEHHLLVHAIERADADDADRVLFGHIRRTRLELARHPELFE
ncbi:MAG: GntR family transcriptional regulator [Microbacteriaceae bacterium]